MLPEGKEGTKDDGRAAFEKSAEKLIDIVSNGSGGGGLAQDAGRAPKGAELR
ncbi:BZ3500_MvSof-1268-A1-R1_Chr3-1g05635 [Microbotryum saponariae]|uniref:BZ3500_MvSof-1268-A1-R1_Chr3-1g05635 protein n=1 Tax=Microbotryum saponariae TaxID=289078 RepID=A0A2X0M6H1_9BASI|nr:BZ3500_MvSof-1268-A1-R1_Chr3-1g05635 [Microbotryum saponariae]SDA04825.1 BZ3501_MvSof-1269-A2-R1_Chr3-1g05305 [Microbotryum saponariae]